MIRSKKDTPSEDFYLTIFNHLEQEWSMNKIAKHYGMTKQALNYYTKPLKANGNIEKLGYGVWKVKSREVKNIRGVGQGGVRICTSSAANLPSDFVRGHSFLVKLFLPKLDHWINRVTYLKNQNIPYKQIVQGQSITIAGVKIWLCDKSIVYYLPKSYYAKDSESAYQFMLNDFYNLIKKTESVLNVKLRFGKEYKFKVARNHYALINNSLAKQYNDPNNKQKLEVRNKKGLWLIVDNSKGLNELEAIHPETAKDDIKKIQDWFNDLKENPHYLPSEQREIQELLAKNIILHLSLIEEVKKLIGKI